MTDSYGNYGFTFEPEVPGQYLIMATFEGTNSYWGSTQTTYLSVDEAPTPTTPIEPEVPGEPEIPLITTEVAIIAAIAIIAVIGIGAFWFLRKR